MVFLIRRQGALALAATALLAIALSAVGCSVGGSSDAPAELTKPRVQPPSGPPPKKLIAEDVVEGSGPAAKPGDEITVNYVAVDKAGKQIYSSWRNRRSTVPFTFQLGSGSAIDGWEEGLRGMRVGGRRELIVSPKLGDGRRTLAYVVDLVRIKPLPWAKRERPQPKVRVPDRPPPSKLVVKDLEDGFGAATKAGDVLLVHHVGVNYLTGEEFEVSWNPITPFTFVLGRGEAIEGWETGLKGMKVGGRRELIIPSRLAYKTDPLIFVVDLLAIE